MAVSAYSVKEVGFGSVSAFTRSFRRLTGETPTSYRTRAISELGGPASEPADVLC